MRFITAAGLGASLALVLTLSAVSQPAEAGAACNELDLSSPCISSSDVKANLIVGGSTGDGRLRIRNANDQTTVELRASTANVTNRFSNSASKSNGLVKAWARINANGTVESCWRCNKDPAQTGRLDVGFYEVDFTPLATDITERPRLATLDGHVDAIPPGTIDLGGDITNASGVRVFTQDPEGVLSDRPFVLMIY
jgi:hypothetical protein